MIVTTFSIRRKQNCIFVNRILNYVNTYKFSSSHYITTQLSVINLTYAVTTEVTYRTILSTNATLLFLHLHYVAGKQFVRI